MIISFIKQFFTYLLTISYLNNDDFQLVTRDEWHANPPIAIEPMSTPTPYVIIHHSYQPPVCLTLNECIKAMQWMQNYHQLNQSWYDIGYNFAIGGDGRVYEGRGWTAIGAHAPKYNNISIGICLIGDWSTVLPTPKQLKIVQKLINYGIKNNYIISNYLLLGHRQVRETECPGDQLFHEIQTWPHFDPTVHLDDN